MKAVSHLPFALIAVPNSLLSIHCTYIAVPYFCKTAGQKALNLGSKYLPSLRWF